MKLPALSTAASLAVLFNVTAPSAADDGQRLLTIDHYVRVTSTVPSIAGQPAQIYVRERVSAGVALRGATAADRVVLFVHGAGTPAEVAFDTPIGDHSWMAYLATNGFDVFSMDTTGYGRSTRPAPMNDPCNLSEAQQAQFVPSLIAAPCKPSYPGQLTNIASDWHDIDAVVDHIRKLRGVQKVSLVAWSLGGPRGRVCRAASGQGEPDGAARARLQSHRGGHRSNIAPEPGCRLQHAIPQRVRRELGSTARLCRPVRSRGARRRLGGDARLRPCGRHLGHGRAARAVHHDVGLERRDDRQRANPHDDHRRRTRQAGDARTCPSRLRRPGRGRQDLRGPGLFVAQRAWEKNHRLMFGASLEWLSKGAVGDQKTGVVRLGY
jgi:pimeloyl-ACP methyl ester carboxylesterase